MIGPNRATQYVIIKIDNVNILTVSPQGWDSWFYVTINVSGYTGNHQLKFSSSIPMGNWFTQYQNVKIDAITVE